MTLAKQYPERMGRPKRADPPVMPPIPAFLGAVVGVQGGAALAKSLFPELGAPGTLGLRVGISAVMLTAAFGPRLHRTTPVELQALIPYGVVLGVMNATSYLALARMPLGLAVTVESVAALGVAVFGSRGPVDLPKLTSAPVGQTRKDRELCEEPDGAS